MAAEKVSKEMMEEIKELKQKYHLSLTQCCLYLE